MAISKRLFAVATLAISLSGCVGFGTNLKGDFTCRAPQGTCAPSHVIDGRATAELSRAETSGLDAARNRAGIASGDLTRTAERTIRIVFPAHVDEAGTLHDEAVAWAVVEKPQWAGELRRREPGAPPPLMRALRNQLKAAQSAGIQSELAVPPAPDPASPAAEEPIPSDPVPSDDTSGNAPSQEPSPFSLASPLALPSTAAEAVAGAHAPAVEGFDMSATPHDRTPRPQTVPDALQFPSIEALEAAAIAKRARRIAPDKARKPPASDTPQEQK